MARLNARQEAKVVWVNYDLVKKEKDDMVKKFPSADAVFSALAEELYAGYKLSAVYDEFSNAYACYLFPSMNAAQNDGMALSARASNPAAALRGLLYRHIHIFNRNWRAVERVVALDDTE